MDSPTPMSHEELLELAEADALGLLDQYEAALFTRSFHNASSAVQEQIRDLQAELSADQSLLPSDEPSPELRGRVLRAVAGAVEAQAADFAPLASIGSGRTERSDEPSIVHSRIPRFAFLWRAAVLVLSVALVIVSYFGFEAGQLNKVLAGAAYSNSIEKEFRAALGPSYSEFVGHPACETIRFASPDNDFEGSVTMYLNPSTHEALVVAMSMPASNTPYTIVSEVNGRQSAKRTIEAGRPIVGIQLGGLSRSEVRSATWAVVDGNGTVVLQSS